MFFTIHKIFHTWGWKGIYSLFFPVSWKQDLEFKNNGYDLIILSKNKGYFTGTYWQLNLFHERLMGSRKK